MTITIFLIFIKLLFHFYVLQVEVKEYLKII